MGHGNIRVVQGVLVGQLPGRVQVVFLKVIGEIPGQGLDGIIGIRKQLIGDRFLDVDCHNRA